MKLFLDTNVLLDILMESRPANYDSSTILQMVENGAVEAVLTTQSIIDASYVYTQQPKNPLGSFKDSIKYILSTVTVSQIDENNIKSAIRDSNDDFEDAVQIDCAIDAGCDSIISSDRKMKEKSRVPVYTPKEFCDLVFS